MWFFRNAQQKLQDAVVAGNISQVESILATSSVNINLQNRINHRTPLHYAYLHNHYDIATLLQHHGAQNNLRDSEGKLPSEYEPAFPEMITVVVYEEQPQQGAGHKPHPANYSYQQQRYSIFNSVGDLYRRFISKPESEASLTSDQSCLV